MKSIYIGVLAIAGACATADAQTAWLNAADGLWNDGAAWSAGVPNGNAALLTNSAAAYTVTVDTTPAAPFGALTVTTAAGLTTRLSVNAPAFTCTNGAMAFGRGAEVVLGSGASLLFSGRTAVTPFLEVKDGGSTSSAEP
jgi:hypothetical protein